MINKHFPQKTYKDVSLSNIRSKTPERKYLIFDRSNPPEDMIPLRMLAGLYGVAYVSLLTNKKKGKQNANMGR